MEIIKKITTPIADIEFKEDGLYYMKVITDQYSIEKITKQTEMLRDEFKLSKQNPGLFINDTKQLSSLKMNKKVRDFFTEPENAEIIKAIAILIDNPLMKISANLYINFSKPPYPTKAFKEEDKAREWLLSLKES